MLFVCLFAINWMKPRRGQKYCDCVKIVIIFIETVSSHGHHSNSYALFFAAILWLRLQSILNFDQKERRKEKWKIICSTMIESKSIQHYNFLLNAHQIIIVFITFASSTYSLHSRKSNQGTMRDQSERKTEKDHNECVEQFKQLKRFTMEKCFRCVGGIVWGHWNGQRSQCERLGAVMLVSIEISFSSIEHIYVISTTFTDPKNEVVQIFGKKFFLRSCNRSNRNKTWLMILKSEIHTRRSMDRCATVH